MLEVEVLKGGGSLGSWTWSGSRAERRNSDSLAGVPRLVRRKGIV